MKWFYSTEIESSKSSAISFRIIFWGWQLLKRRGGWQNLRASDPAVLQSIFKFTSINVFIQTTSQFPFRRICFSIKTRIFLWRQLQTDFPYSLRPRFVYRLHNSKEFLNCSTAQHYTLFQTKQVLALKLALEGYLITLTETVLLSVADFHSNITGNYPGQCIHSGRNIILKTRGDMWCL